MCSLHDPKASMLHTRLPPPVVALPFPRAAAVLPLPRATAGPPNHAPPRLGALSGSSTSHRGSSPPPRDPGSSPKRAVCGRRHPTARRRRHPAPRAPPRTYSRATANRRLTPAPTHTSHRETPAATPMPQSAPPRTSPRAASNCSVRRREPLPHSCDRSPDPTGRRSQLAVSLSSRLPFSQMASTCLLYISSSIERLPYSVYLGSKSSAPLPLTSSLDELHRPGTHERPPARLAPGRRRAQRRSPARVPHLCSCVALVVCRRAPSGRRLDDGPDAVRCCDLLHREGHTTCTVLSPTPWHQDDRARRK